MKKIMAEIKDLEIRLAGKMDYIISGVDHPKLEQALKKLESSQNVSIDRRDGDGTEMNFIIHSEGRSDLKKLENAIHEIAQKFQMSVQRRDG